MRLLVPYLPTTVHYPNTFDAQVLALLFGRHFPDRSKLRGPGHFQLDRSSPRPCMHSVTYNSHRCLTGRSIFKSADGFDPSVPPYRELDGAVLANNLARAINQPGSVRFTSTTPCNVPKQKNLPASIEAVLDVIEHRYKDLESGVSDTTQILEGLNQVIASIRSLPNSTDDLAGRVFSESRLVSFLNNSVLKSVRRFTPSDIMKTLLIASRAEGLHVSALRELLELTLAKLIIPPPNNPSCLGGLSVSSFCQLPLYLSNFPHLTPEASQTVLEWMNDSVRYGHR